MSGAAQIIGALLMYGIGGAGPMAIANWRVIFLVAGALTVLSGFVFIFCVPSDPTKAWFFTEDEKRVAIERLALDRATRDRSAFTPPQMKEALLDVKVWLVFGMALFITIPSPILKVRKKFAASTWILITKLCTVLFFGSERFWMEQVQHHACWTTHGCHTNDSYLHLRIRHAGNS